MRCGGGPHNLEDPPAHLWSGHSALIGRVPTTLVDVVPALQGFGETLEESRKACLEQLRLVANARWIDAGVRKRPVWKKVSNNDQLIPTRRSEARPPVRPRLFFEPLERASPRRSNRGAASLVGRCAADRPPTRGRHWSHAPHTAVLGTRRKNSLSRMPRFRPRAGGTRHSCRSRQNRRRGRLQLAAFPCTRRGRHYYYQYPLLIQAPRCYA